MSFVVIFPTVAKSPAEGQWFRLQQIFVDVEFLRLWPNRDCHDSTLNISVARLALEVAEHTNGSLEEGYVIEVRRQLFGSIRRLDKVVVICHDWFVLLRNKDWGWRDLEYKLNGCGNQSQGPTGLISANARISNEINASVKVKVRTKRKMKNHEIQTMRATRSLLAPTPPNRPLLDDVATLIIQLLFQILAQLPIITPGRQLAPWKDSTMPLLGSVGHHY